MKSSIIKRSIVIAAHKTSVSVEDDFWEALHKIAEQRHETLSHLIASIDADRQHANLSSAIRLYVLGFYRDQYEARAALDPSIRQSPTVQSAISRL
jgi:predicted DNA-binding ribbon-helix-helix protein